MKTLKALKITSILQILFCLFCMISTVGFAFGDPFENYILFAIAEFSLYGWIANPVGIISFIVCLRLFLKERKAPESKQIIGKKWIWIFIWPIITTLFWIIGGGLMVKFTGGA